MRILITNDDGIGAEGLKFLALTLTALGHTVWAVAPQKNWSGKSQAITVQGPLSAWREPGWPASLAWRVHGSPADSVRAAEALLPGVPDVVVSGINLGCNLGADIYRSGTVGAAREAVLKGWPGLALSQCGHLDPETLRRHLPQLLSLALSKAGTVVNVNFPDGAAGELALVPPAWDAQQETAMARADGLVGLVRIDFSRRIAVGDGELDDVRAVAAGLVAVSVLPVRVGSAVPARLDVRAAI
jgi:5'-nucleotidase